MVFEGINLSHNFNKAFAKQMSLIELCEVEYESRGRRVT